MTDQDLEGFSNRGTVKRVRRQLDETAAEATLEETAEGVTCSFPDGAVATLAGDAPLDDARCTCPAAGACRHQVAMVLLYQRIHTDADEAPPPRAPWDPGAISDEALEAVLGARVMGRARKRFETGLLVELVRSPKPLAVFHGLGVTARFLVAGDPRYVQTDAKGAAAEDAVAMGVWAFRRLAPDKLAGYVSTDTSRPAVPTNLVENASGLLGSLWRDGLTSGSPYLIDHLEQLKGELQREAWIWPAENLGTLNRELVLYQQHDSQFDPARAVRAVGELNARVDALVRFTGATPVQLVRGSGSDSPQELKALRLVGLGCEIRQVRGGVRLRACFQSAGTGRALVLERRFAEPASAEPPRPFSVLAQTQHVKGTTLRDLGAGQLLAASAKRSPRLTLSFGRRVTVNPQTYEWERLGEPLLVSDFEELGARLGDRPPSAVSALNAAEGLYVLVIREISAARFDHALQQVQATLIDEHGNEARLIHPYTDRGATGTESLLALLEGRPEAVRFISGRVRYRTRGVVVSPVGVVWERSKGRELLQPWIDRHIALETPPVSPQAVDGSLPPDPVRRWLDQVEQGLGELMLLGLTHVDSETARRWRQLARSGAAVGFVRLAHRVGELAAVLEQGRHYAKCPADLLERAVRHSMALCKWLRLLPEALAAWTE